MECERASTPLHDRLLIAVERAAHVQETSSTLIDQQHTIVSALRETVATIHQRRRSDEPR